MLFIRLNSEQKRKKNIEMLLAFILNRLECKQLPARTSASIHLKQYHYGPVTPHPLHVEKCDNDYSNKYPWAWAILPSIRFEVLGYPDPKMYGSVKRTVPMEIFWQRNVGYQCAISVQVSHQTACE